MEPRAERLPRVPAGLSIRAFEIPVRFVDPAGPARGRFASTRCQPVEVLSSPTPEPVEVL